MKSFCQALLFILCVQLCSQEANAQKNVIKTNLGGVINGNYGLTYEFVLGDAISASLSGNYVTSNGEELGYDILSKIGERGYNIIPEIRWYVGNRYESAPRNTFVGFNVIIEKLNVNVEGVRNDSIVVDLDGEVKNLGFGLVLGYQWIVADRFAFDLFFNPYYNSGRIDGDVANNQQYYTRRDGFQFNRIGLGIGIAF